MLLRVLQPASVNSITKTGKLVIWVTTKNRPKVGNTLYLGLS